MPRLRLVVPWALSALAALAVPAAGNESSAQTKQTRPPALIFGQLAGGGPTKAVEVTDEPELAAKKRSGSGWDSFVETEGVVVQPVPQSPSTRLASKPERDLSPASVLQLEPETGPSPAPESESSWSFWPSGTGCETCDDGSCTCDGGYFGNYSGKACWTARVDALGLWRNNPKSQPLFTSLTGTPPNQAIGPVVLNGDQLTSDPAAGTRISLFRTNDCGASVETTYIYAGNFYSERSLPYEANAYAIASGIYGNIWGQDPPTQFPPPLSAVQTQLTGQLQSLEFNSRTPLWGGKTLFISGFRWLQWQERLIMDDQFFDYRTPSITGSDRYDTRCVNDLYGGQIGFDSQLLAYPRGFQLEGMVKAGAYYNSAVQTSSYSYVTTAPFSFADSISVSGQPAAGAFVGEVGLTGVIPLGRHFDLRVGYFGLWLEAIAQPVAQLTSQDLTQPDVPPPTGKLVTTGGVVLQGISLGLEGHW
jgi:hypothetical protein